jgi:hypothetical protein
MPKRKIEQRVSTKALAELGAMPDNAWAKKWKCSIPSARRARIDAGMPPYRVKRAVEGELNKAVTAWVSVPEHRKITRAAKAAKMSISDFVAMTLIQSMK